MIKAIVAMGENGEIGQNGMLPWQGSYPEDLKHFKEMTKDSVVVMGGSTFRSLPFDNGLPERHNAVLTSEVGDEHEDGWFMVSDNVCFVNEAYLTKCLDLKDHMIDDLWIIGGASIYNEYKDYVDEWYVTRIYKSFPDADTYFSEENTKDLHDNFEVKSVASSSGDCDIVLYTRKEV